MIFSRELRFDIWTVLLLFCAALVLHFGLLGLMATSGTTCHVAGGQNATCLVQNAIADLALVAAFVGAAVGFVLGWSVRLITQERLLQGVRSPLVFASFSSLRRALRRGILQRRESSDDFIGRLVRV